MRAATVAGLALLVSGLACEGAGPGSSEAEAEAESGPPSDIWIDFADGCSVEPYVAIEEAEPPTITMVLGGQGLLMFPLHIRAGGFDLPPDLSPVDPGAPRLDLNVYVDGYNDGPGDTFARIANYPVFFSEVEGEDQTYQFRYLTVFVPDEVSGSGSNEQPTAVDGKIARFEWSFEVADEAPLEGSFTAVIEVPQPFEPEPSCGF